MTSPLSKPFCLPGSTGGIYRYGMVVMDAWVLGSDSGMGLVHGDVLYIIMVVAD